MTLLDTPTVCRASDLARLPDARDYELVDGGLVERHTSMESSRVASKTNRLLGNEADRTGEAFVYANDLGYQCYPDDPERVRKPDGSVIRRDRVGPLGGHRGYSPIPADLVVEVVSPGDLANAVAVKLREYLDAGFGLVWAVHPPVRTVTVYRGDGTVLTRRPGQRIAADPDLAAFGCDVAEFFDPPAPR